jgi:hypothetical protein
VSFKHKPIYTTLLKLPQATSTRKTVLLFCLPKLELISPSFPRSPTWSEVYSSCEENGIDPNRDFAHNVASNTPSKCMETITARAANELGREHMFQLSVTFHSGTLAITTEWGSYNHYSNGKSTYSPDDLAQNAIDSAMSAWAGRERSEGFYPSAQ